MAAGKYMADGRPTYETLSAERDQLRRDLCAATRLAARLCREDRRESNEELIAGLAREVIRLQVRQERARRALRDD